MAHQRRKPKQRPSPDALLEAARREEGHIGKFRIFVGAAPGVGKTYGMLQSARARVKDGYEVVIGVVDPHGRKETEALLEGLEIIPCQRIEHKGRLLYEMDLDAIIARRPQSVLVDELAHTNAPGSRHPKRYLDVDELLSHSIDVYSTVNIQPIESLNDVVAQITHVRVRATVRDSVFDRADAVELVDLTPDDLIQRLKEGVFSLLPISPRSASLPFAAPRIGLTSNYSVECIPGPWAAGERILVCISEDLPMMEIGRVLFEQVLFNLLDNAAKYAPSGTTVRIQSCRDNDSIELQVLDEGGGILPGDLEQIFDKFYRARKLDQVRAGTGLGLAISRGFIEAMHETISAANRTDVTGAVFTIRLPVPAHAKRLDTVA